MYWVFDLSLIILRLREALKTVLTEKVKEKMKEKMKEMITTLKFNSLIRICENNESKNSEFWDDITDFKIFISESRQDLERSKSKLLRNMMYTKKILTTMN